MTLIDYGTTSGVQCTALHSLCTWTGGHRHNLRGMRGTGTPHFSEWGTVPPLFRTQVKNFLSSEAIFRY